MSLVGNSLLAKTYTAPTAINPYLIVKWGSNDGEVAQASAATDLLIGVVNSVGSVSSNDRIEVNRSGLVPVLFGGTVTRGQKLTADSNGKAVAAAPSAGSNVHIVGVAENSQVSGDIGYIQISLSVMQG